MVLTPNRRHQRHNTIPLSYDLLSDHTAEDPVQILPPFHETLQSAPRMTAKRVTHYPNQSRWPRSPG
jgi:hypothetical protein